MRDSNIMTKIIRGKLIIDPGLIIRNTTRGPDGPICLSGGVEILTNTGYKQIGNLVESDDIVTIKTQEEDNLIYNRYIIVVE